MGIGLNDYNSDTMHWESGEECDGDCSDLDWWAPDLPEAGQYWTVNVDSSEDIHSMMKLNQHHRQNLCVVCDMPETASPTTAAPTSAAPTTASHHYISRGYSNSGHFDGDVVSYCQDVDNNQAAYWSRRNDFDGNDFGYDIGVRCCKDEDDGTVTGYSPDCDAYPATYDDAVKVCTEDNDYRLCTRDEMESDITKGTGCRFNHVYRWTSDECQSSGCDAASFTASGCAEGTNCL